MATALRAGIALLLASFAAAGTVEPPSSSKAPHEPAEPKYIIGLNTKKADVPRDVNELSTKNLVIMTDAEGQKFACKMPDPSASEGAEKEGSKGPDRTTEEILDSMGSACFYRVEGWWTYEFCYKKHVRQFHQEREQVMSDYFLGLYDPAASEQLMRFKGNDASAVDPGAAGTQPQRYHAQVYTNGTDCDLTGEKRQTEVRFLCTVDANNFISSIKEPSTCRYVLTFYTPVLCKHEDFKVQEQKIEHIRCEAFADPAAADGPAAAGAGEGRGEGEAGPGAVGAGRGEGGGGEGEGPGAGGAGGGEAEKEEAVDADDGADDDDDTYEEDDEEDEDGEEDEDEDEDGGGEGAHGEL